MKTYMVHFRRNAYTQISPDIIKKEQERMGELMRENIIQQVYMNKTMDNLWMVFKIDNEEILREIIQTLPMCKDLYFEANELMG
jgi:muconolactone delta-isomerase